jgi:para-aminobenzoate synthetase component 1
VTQAAEKTKLNTHFQAVVKELTPAPLVQDALLSFSQLPGCLLLDSSMRIQSPDSQPLGRFSFLMADPFETVVEPVGTSRPFEKLRDLLARYATKTIPDLPPMQGGVAGMFSYDLSRSIEKIAPPPHDEFQAPAIVAGAYDTVIAWDHQQDRAWIISQGFPELDIDARQKRAQSRVDFFESVIAGSLVGAESQPRIAPRDVPKDKLNRGVAASDLAPFFDVDGPEGLISNFSRESYVDAVQQCIDYIHSGDVFQINLAQRLLFPSNCGSIQLYQRLRQCNPAPFSGYFDLSRICDCDAQIISASPERFFSVRDGMVESRPIKGTRPRTGRPMVDIHGRDQLLSSVKDRAENTMIVDLMRNDLSRVCTDDSICVTQLCEIEEYQSVLHLVSVVQGQLNPHCDVVDLLAAVFPGGSITGAPKVRAMEIITELESTARGAYCGALGYLGFDGTADLSILIRTITASSGWWQIPVGGGIVGQSDPNREYKETWTKAAGMLRAVTMREA